MNNQKVWLITGSSTGFGREIATEALKKGYRVVATARNTDKLKDLTEAYPERAIALSLDVTDKAQIEQAIKDAINTFGQIDVLVNNAGYGLMSAIEELSDEQIRSQFETNVFGLLNVTKAILPQLRQQKSGHIIMMSSIAGLVGKPPGFGIYNATKHAVEGISETLANEIEPFGIGLTIVEPGPFRTKFNESSLAQAEAMEEYSATVGQTRQFIAQEFSNIASDPQAGAKAIIRAIESENPPLRLLLGKPALENARKQLSAMMAEIDRWEELTLSVD